MDPPAFECLHAVPLLGKDGLCTLSSISLLPCPIENSLTVAASGFDGLVSLIQFNDASADSNPSSRTVHSGTASTMDVDGALPSTTESGSSGQKFSSDVITIGRDNYPVLSVATVSREKWTLMAFGGLGRQIRLSIRDANSFPTFLPLLDLPVSSPVNTLEIQTLSFVQREETTWNVRVFWGSQDKAIHLLSVSVVLSAAGTYTASPFHHLSFIGHGAYVRALAFQHSETKEATHLLSAGDDFVFKIWPLNLLEGEKITRCTTYEGHQDDIVAIDCRNGWVMTGSKDKTVAFCDITPGKTARAEKNKEVKLEKVYIGTVIRSVLLSEDATMAFAGCGDGTLKVLRRQPGETSNAWILLHSHQLTSGPIYSLIYTQNVLVTGSSDESRAVAVWKLPQM